MRGVDARLTTAAAAASWMSAAEWATRTMRYRRGGRKLPSKNRRSIFKKNGLGPSTGSGLFFACAYRRSELRAHDFRAHDVTDGQLLALQQVAVRVERVPT